MACSVLCAIPHQSVHACKGPRHPSIIMWALASWSGAPGSELTWYTRSHTTALFDELARWGIENVAV